MDWEDERLEHKRVEHDAMDLVAVLGLLAVIVAAITAATWAWHRFAPALGF